ncbi:hypothetical protein R1flu_001779 [Riccia fluitans]|uniref:Major facilitator superfamily (MFS) profile domain-containing protein n=1 Tax=Riccia fluitans TaxID=41844 RepID=A0ABD1Y883_9MARC
MIAERRKRSSSNNDERKEQHLQKQQQLDIARKDERQIHQLPKANNSTRADPHDPKSGVLGRQGSCAIAAVSTGGKNQVFSPGPCGFARGVVQIRKVPGMAPSNDAPHSGTAEHHRSLKVPLLKKIRDRSRHITREESRIGEKWVYFSTCTAVMGIAALGFWMGYTSPVQQAMIESLSLTVSEFSVFGSLITVGAMLGAVLSGQLGDWLGRKRAMVVGCLPIIVGSALVAFAESKMPLYIGRFLTGAGGGLFSFIVPLYIGEIAPRHLRGTLGSMQQLANTMGIVLAYLGGLFFNWRYLAASGMIPGLLCLVGITMIPESPRWLAKKERAEELEAALKKLRGEKYDVSNELAEMQQTVEAAKLEPKAKFTDLFKRRLARPLLAGVGLQFLQQFSGINGVMLYASAIFSSAGVSNANVASLGLGALQVAMTVAAAGLMDKAGRRLLLMVSASGMALSCFLVGFTFYLRSVQPHNYSSGMNVFIDILALASLLVYISAFSLGMGPIPWILLGEIFPAQVKGVAGSVATLTNWSCAWVITLAFNIVFQWSSAGAFWIFALACVCTVFFVGLCLPETRGRTLEQIEESFR